MSLPLTRPDIVLFDWDNTLVDTWPTIHEALNVTLESMGHRPWSLDEVRANVKKSMRDAFPAMFGDRWEEASALYQAHYRIIQLRNLQPLAGADAMLRLLESQAIPMAVVSNKRGENLRRECDHLGWSQRFFAIIGADDAAHDKPHRAPADMALTALKSAPKNAAIWFIGDTVVDIECAHQLGAVPILYGVDAAHPLMLDGFALAAITPDHAALSALLRQQLNVAA